MPKPLTSEFKTTGRPDTKIHLASGSKIIQTVLTRDLSAEENDVICVTDGGKADIQGAVVIDDEIILYHEYRWSSPECFVDLLRGQRGTVRTTHKAGAVVTILDRPKFSNPAIGDSIISAQEELVALRTLLEQLQRRVEVLENKS